MFGLPLDDGLLTEEQKKRLDSLVGQVTGPGYTACLDQFFSTLTEDELKTMLGRCLEKERLDVAIELVRRGYVTRHLLQGVYFWNLVVASGSLKFVHWLYTFFKRPCDSDTLKLAAPHAKMLAFLIEKFYSDTPPHKVVQVCLPEVLKTSSPKQSLLVLLNLGSKCHEQWHDDAVLWPLLSQHQFECLDAIYDKYPWEVTSYVTSPKLHTLLEDRQHWPVLTWLLRKSVAVVPVLDLDLDVDSYINLTWILSTNLAPVLDFVWRHCAWFRTRLKDKALDAFLYCLTHDKLASAGWISHKVTLGIKPGTFRDVRFASASTLRWLVERLHLDVSELPHFIFLATQFEYEELAWLEKTYTTKQLALYMLFPEQDVWITANLPMHLYFDWLDLRVDPQYFVRLYNKLACMPPENLNQQKAVKYLRRKLASIEGLSTVNVTRQSKKADEGAQCVTMFNIDSCDTETHESHESPKCVSSACQPQPSSPWQQLLEQVAGQELRVQTLDGMTDFLQHVPEQHRQPLWEAALVNYFRCSFCSV